MTERLKISLDAVAIAYISAGGKVIIDDLNVEVSAGGALRKILHRVKTRVDSGVYRQPLLPPAKDVE